MGALETFIFSGDGARRTGPQYVRFWFSRSADMCIEIKAPKQHSLNKAGGKIMCVCQGFGVYCITSLAPSSPSRMRVALGDSGSQTLHYGYYSVARPKGAGEEGFIMFQGSEEAFFLCEEDKACLRSKHPAPSLLFSSPLSRLWKRCPSYRTDKWTRRWTRQSIRVNVTAQRLSCTMLTGIKQNPRLLLFLPQYRSWKKKKGCRKMEQCSLPFPTFQISVRVARAV